MEAQQVRPLDKRDGCGVMRVQVQQPLVPRELPAGPHVAARAGRAEAAGHDHGSVRGLQLHVFDEFWL